MKSVQKQARVEAGGIREAALPARADVIVPGEGSDLPSPGLRRLTCGEIWKLFEKAEADQEKAAILTGLRFASASTETTFSDHDRRTSHRRLERLVLDSRLGHPVRLAAQLSLISIVPLGSEADVLHEMHFREVKSKDSWRFIGRDELYARHFRNYLNQPEEMFAWIKLYAPESIYYSEPKLTTEDYPYGDFLAFNLGFLKELGAFIRGIGEASALRDAWKLPSFIDPAGLPLLTAQGEERVCGNASWTTDRLAWLSDIADMILGRDTVASKELTTEQFHNLQPSEQERLITRIGNEMVSLSREVQQELRTDIFRTKHGTHLRQFHFGMTGDEMRKDIGKHRLSYPIYDPTEAENYLQYLGYKNLRVDTELSKRLSQDFVTRSNGPQGEANIPSHDFLTHLDELPAHVDGGYLDVPFDCWDNRGAYVVREWIEFLKDKPRLKVEYGCLLVETDRIKNLRASQVLALEGVTEIFFELDKFDKKLFKKVATLAASIARERPDLKGHIMAGNFEEKDFPRILEMARVKRSEEWPSWYLNRRRHDGRQAERKLRLGEAAVVESD